MELLLLLYILMAGGIGFLEFLCPSTRGRARFIRAFGSVGILAAVFLILLAFNKGNEIELVLFQFVWMAGALAVAIRVSRPAFRRGGLTGFLIFLACGVVISLIVFHPWNHLVAGQSTSEHMGIRNRTFYTIWYVIIPIMLGSLFNPRASTRFLHGWKTFCYTYVLLSVLNVRLEQYLYYRFGEPHDLYLRFIPCFNWAPFTFPVLSVLAALFLSRLLRKPRRSKTEAVSP